MQSRNATETGQVADAPRGNWVDKWAPEKAKPYLRMARLDRPIGFLLLFWPCAFSLCLSVLADPVRGFDIFALVLFFVGAIAMRGAGCTFNDIVDRNLDGKVARTRSRPLPSGQVGVRGAALFMGAQALVGFFVLIQFNLFTILLGLASLGLVAIYPFMKRITYWPQLFLGLCFSWGALMGWASQFAGLGWPPVLLYLGSILWVIGYDTVYALQDVEDDSLIGIKSTARLFGEAARPMIALFYAGGFVLWLGAAALAGASLIAWIASLPAAALLAWQAITLRPDDPQGCLQRFKANHFVGLALSLALIADWLL